LVQACDGKLNVPGSGRSAAPAVPGLIEPLTGRELQVLAILAARTPIHARAGELFISIDTVKKHVSQVLGKLGAVNRTEPVARARDLGLLP
jgi:LuxR family maltose regulon positive regulatory protein